MASRDRSTHTPPRPGRLARPVLALAAAAALGGGLVLATAATAFAQGDDSSSPPSGASLLGGWTLTSSAAGVSAYYEQPNFPIPATPSLEFDLGYSNASYDAGPTGNSNASALWPGPVVGGGDTNLPLLIDPYLEQYAGPLASTIEPLVPDSNTWPIQALSEYPQGPTTASNNNGPTSMDSSADASGSSASSSLGLVGGSADESSLPSGMLTVQSIGSTSQETIDDLGNAISEATSTVHGIDIAGFIDIGAVTSTATSSSNGNQATVSGSSAVSDMTIAGEPVTVSSSGISAAGNTENLLGSLVPNVNQILSTAGITITLTNPTDTVQGASGERQLDGLKVTIDLSTYDQDFNQLVAELPSSITSNLDQLPVPSPYKQSITLDIGWANVNADATPPFNLSAVTPGTSTLSTPTLGSITPSSSSPSFTATPSSATGSAPSPGSDISPTADIVKATPVALFRGIGTGLIIAGAVLAAVLVGLLLGMDGAVGRLAAAVPCVGEDTGGIG